MNQMTLAWGALRNLARTAAHDPVWAITAAILSPVRAVRHLLGITFAVLAVGFVLALFSEAIPRDLWWLRAASGIVVLGVPLVLAFRLLTNPLIEHFGDRGGDTHGSARFATAREIAPLARATTGLLVGRDGRTGKLLRYDGPAHLLTMAPEGFRRA